MSRILIAMVVAGCMTFASYAQEQTGSIDGRLINPAGLGGGVPITAKGEGGFVSEVQTDDEGLFRFASLPVGRYEIIAAIEGATSRRVELRLGTTASVDLHAGPRLDEEISVEANAPLLEITSSAGSAVYSADVFDNLPHNRDFSRIVEFAGGATFEPRARGISVHGASGAENRVILDGVDITDPLDGTASRAVFTEALSDVQVKLTGYEAEFGGATGGVVNLISRSGSNELMGSLFGHYNDEDWSGETRPRLPINGAGIAFATPPLEKDSTEIFDPGLVLSGPLVRDRIWFFGAYAPKYTTTTRTVGYRFVDLVEKKESEFESRNSVVNLTGAVTSAINAKIVVSTADAETRGVLPLAVQNPDPTLDLIREDRSNEVVSAYVDAMLTPSWSVSLRGGRLRKNTRQTGRPNEIKYYFSTSNAGIEGIPSDLVKGADFSNIPFNDTIDHDRFERTSLSADASHYFAFLGHHSVKGGVQVERLSNDVRSGNQQPLFDFLWNSGDYIYGDRARGAFGVLRITMYTTMGSVTGENTALFIQDRWSLPGDRLTLNLGLRAEEESIPSYADGSLNLRETAIGFDYGEKLAPRFGLAYDVRGDQRWKVYGSYGTFYDRIKLALPRKIFGGDREVSYVFKLNTFDWPSIQCSGINVLPSDRPTCNGAELFAVDDFIPASALAELAVDRDLKPMQSREWTAGAEHQLTSQAQIAIRYVHKELVRAVETVGIGPPNGRRVVLANPGYGLAREVAPGIILPKPVRDYDGIEIDVTGRALGSRLWMHASYLYSRLRGNYSGVFNSDQLQPQAPYAGTFANAPTNLYDATGSPVYGALATDRPHQLKVQTSYAAGGGFTVGLNQFVGSGTPVSTEMRFRNQSFFPYGRGDLGRTPTLSQTDLLILKRFDFRNSGIELSANVLNLFDQDTPVSIYSLYSQRNIFTGTDEQFFAGFDVEALKANLTRSPFFGEPAAYQAPREVRVGLKLSF